MHRNQQMRDREWNQQQQGLGQRGNFEQSYGGYDEGRYGGGSDRGGPDRYEQRSRGGYDQRGHDQRGGYDQRGGHDRGGHDRYEQRGSHFDRGGGYDRQEQRAGVCEHCGRAYDEGRFGGSRREAYDHDRHPRSMRGNSGYRYEQDRSYEQTGYSNRGGYEPYPMNRDHGNMQRTGFDRGGYEEADDDRRYHGSSQRGYDADWYGRDTMSPWSRR